MGYYINVEPDVKIYVEDLNPAGKKTILFLHGWPASHKLFEYQFNYLPMMGYRCIGIDTRGFGDSDKPWRGYDYDRLADDVRCVIDTLKLHDIVLGGHSTGGAIAIRYMARHKGHGVAKLALFAAAAPSLVQRPYFPYGVPKEGIEEMIQETYNNRPEMLRRFGQRFFHKFITESFEEWFFQLGLQAAGWATAAIARTWLGEEGLFTDLGKIFVPTLILHGIHDQVCPFALAEAQHRGIRNSKLIPFRDSGHGLFYDEKDRFNQELIKFIEE
ncbi:alpha/beta fold hydrolase [Defluviitalea raffinosedens]|jgi:non-heme chloroperoxidase|uniref:Alpha/beta fold hydrolase n=1 Tax=Defluviitalea raffinosedens TaxID=1450156 RepID=A0A7C8HG01_9FIRM|nr:alpha/beta hydrolase [Defluviitalea raffinosedens]KAE9634929.1 alpha/beta fold hydrolase [Defluviitalea raffinosedens]MBM7685720.1 non-heme chloroperoxidase [Defluviitalea raffinosedens]MBZ4667476.1 alpha/beta superfamily hydrolase [Defluviitaleaceae bacterium]HHW66563.1 alpha/beta hydrolase [Candidatus Epulonipiscium sp.]